MVSRSKSDTRVQPPRVPKLQNIVFPSVPKLDDGSILGYYSKLKLLIGQLDRISKKVGLTDDCARRFFFLFFSLLIFWSELDRP